MGIGQSSSFSLTRGAILTGGGILERFTSSRILIFSVRIWLGRLGVGKVSNFGQIGALVLFFRRFWLFEVAKGGESKGRIYHKLMHRFQSWGGVRVVSTHYQLYIIYLDLRLLSSSKRGNCRSKYDMKFYEVLVVSKISASHVWYKSRIQKFKIIN